MWIQYGKLVNIFGSNSARRGHYFRREAASRVEEEVRMKKVKNIKKVFKDEMMGKILKSRLN